MWLMDKKLRVLAAVAFSAILWSAAFIHPAAAADPSMTLFPTSGYAVLGKAFSVDILVDTGGAETTFTRAVFRFDPSQVRVTKAEYGDLYCEYPEDEYTVDNTLGWVKLTGFCQDDYYTSDGAPGLFGRITFTPLVEGNASFMFVTEYEDEEWESTMIEAGSPPQTITGIDYGGGTFTYTVVSSIPDGNDQGQLPGVGLFDERWVLTGIGLVAVGVLLAVGGRLYRSAHERHRFGSDRTVVISS